MSWPWRLRFVTAWTPVNDRACLPSFTVADSLDEMEGLQRETAGQGDVVRKPCRAELFTGKPGFLALTKVEIVLAIPAAVFNLLFLVKFFTSS